MQDTDEYIDIQQYHQHLHHQHHIQQQQSIVVPASTATHLASGISNGVTDYQHLNNLHHHHYHLHDVASSSSSSPSFQTLSHHPSAYINHQLPSSQFATDTTDFATGSRNIYADTVFDADLVAAAACYYGAAGTTGHGSYFLPSTSVAGDLSGSTTIGGGFGVDFNGFAAGCSGGSGATYYHHFSATGSVTSPSAGGAKLTRKPTAVVGGRDEKFCGVCGDRALSYNFDAISCESCKAFFRRNAPKGLENFKCPYEERCRMDVSNRRFCKRCRLNKCFLIGMRKEYILTDEEKAQKRQKIESNRMMRSKSDPNGKRHSTSAVVSGSGGGGSAPISSSYSVSSGEVSYGDYDDHSPPTVPEFTCSNVNSEAATSGGAVEVTSQTVALQPEDAREIDELVAAYRASLETQQQNSEVGRTGGGGYHSSHQDPIRSSFVFDRNESRRWAADFGSDTAFRAAFDSFGGHQGGGSGPVGVAPMSAGVYGSQQVRQPPGTANSLADLVNIAELSMRRVIAMTKQIASFRSLPQPDQIRLLKFGSIELLILRSVLTFDAEKQHFLDPCDDEQTAAMNVAELRHAEAECGATEEGGMFDDHMRFIRSLVIDLRADETTLVLLLVVSLFSPDRDNLASREFVAGEQERYCMLLKRYIESRHAAPAARLMFARLVAKLAEVRTLNEEHSHVLLKLNPAGIQPLMKEVLDLRPLPMREPLGASGVPGYAAAAGV